MAPPVRARPPRRRRRRPDRVAASLWTWPSRQRVYAQISGDGLPGADTDPAPSGRVRSAAGEVSISAGQRPYPALAGACSLRLDAGVFARAWRVSPDAVKERLTAALGPPLFKLP
jgi:hypothetical protein